jgi:anaerobic selenocysteine-containing dehydrogenase/Fe-S-cluster-containing dehydrogenase component
MKRRTFLKMAGLGSVAFAAGCGSESEKKLLSLVSAPDDLVTGKAAWYASVCRECPAGCGILVKNREGRAIKIEGNPLHPVNKGKLCMRGQAALQNVYHPDRLSKPQMKEGPGWRSIGFAEAERVFREKASSAAQSGTDRIRMLTELPGESLLSLFSAGMKKWRSGLPLICEPLSSPSLKTANEAVWGRSGLASYRLEKADLLISFGADFLETWLSPVAYAAGFKAMHGLKDGKKGRFFHISPFQSLTAANADRWLCCKPGSEAIPALGLIRESLQSGKGDFFPKDFRLALQQKVAAYSPETVSRNCDIPLEAYQKLLTALGESRAPLILGGGAASWGENSAVTDLAACLLTSLHDPKLSLVDFHHSHRIAAAAPMADVIDFFDRLNREPPALLILNHVNPLFSLPPAAGVEVALKREDLYVVCFSDVMDDTARLADLVIPVRHSLESWDEYSGQNGFRGIQQPVMAPLSEAPGLGDLFLNVAFPEEKPAKDFKSYVRSRLFATHGIADERQWIDSVRQGGVFPRSDEARAVGVLPVLNQQAVLKELSAISVSEDKAGTPELTFMAAPSIRFFDGRGGNKPWLCEAPDPLTQVAWQTPVLVHPKTLSQYDLSHEDLVRIKSAHGEIIATVYETEGVHPSALVMYMGQGHRDYSRYARGIGTNPMTIISAKPVPETGLVLAAVRSVDIQKTGQTAALAHTDGSRIQHGRKIALYTALSPQKQETPLAGHGKSPGLTMNDFPLTLPLPEGYGPERDFYPPHDHDGYRWSMVVDLDRCVGCGACAVACYAENNIGVVGEASILRGREMAWLQIQRYHDMEDPSRILFLPMMCQHCDNAPCESVCPVYAPHHSKEGLNNQIYNRCIGTRFCVQNCPYKVRRFNWFEWKWPSPLEKQLNPNVTVRAKGVMEKCSFCIQRIKEAHGVAKDENRAIRDGEVIPACAQTCPTDALVFGNLMDPGSRVRRLVSDPRAYQVMGYLNTKPAVIYLKKVIHV